MKHRIAFTRLGAYLIDYCLIAFYIGTLIAFNFLYLEGSFDPVSTFEQKFRGYAIAFATLTLPVWLYFTIQEAGTKQATIGKRILKIEVRGDGEIKPQLSTIALRNVVKFLPWEIAHAAIWYSSGQPFVDAMPNINLAICAVTLIIAAAYVISLFIGEGRTPYDRISGTQVLSAQPPKATARSLSPHDRFTPTKPN